MNNKCRWKCTGKTYLDRLASILSEINEIKQIINQIPEEAVIERISFQNRLDKILAELEEYVKANLERLFSQANQETYKCKWKHIQELYEIQDYWETDCGQAHQFMDGGPKDNIYIFCPYCGKEIEEVSENDN